MSVALAASHAKNVFKCLIKFSCIISETDQFAKSEFGHKQPMEPSKGQPV